MVFSGYPDKTYIQFEILSIYYNHQIKDYYKLSSLVFVLFPYLVLHDSFSFRHSRNTYTTINEIIDVCNHSTKTSL